MPDQPEITTQAQDEIESAVTEESQIAISPVPASISSKVEGERGFDWLAMGLVVLIAAFFAITARFHAQPATSLVPIAVLSATGVGLFVTALRKIRPVRGPGVFEAGLGGFFVAIFQFLAAISYPGVFDTLATSSTQLQGFLNTWGLILVASIVFSIVGIALGNLAFAPLRPLSARAESSEEAKDVVVEDLQTDQATIEENQPGAVSEDEDDTTVENEQDTDAADTAITNSSQPSRSFASYVIAIFLLGLAPTLIGYIFSAAYSAVLSLNGFTLSPYPTLRLLSALLPWQLPVSVSLNGSTGNFIIFSLLWYIPLFFGNPSLFDLQALEPLVFNGAALALLLLIMHKRDTHTTGQPSLVSWKTFLLLQALLGLIIVFPADLWLLQGIKGILQLQDVAIPIRSLQVLDPLTFILNLISGPLVCLAIGIVLRKMSKQWFSIHRLK
ncbi:MAG TPA: hypothetical protein VJ761_16795 [Ktedonobacteraceae bacterium]|nr:hypothetical protein [Ktedonobacteraceae bacterium]